MIGILPAAGLAERMHGLPKFLLPIPKGFLLKRHVEMMQATRWIGRVHNRSGIFIPASTENYQLIAKYQWMHDMVYVATKHHTMSQTVLSASVENEPVLFGMPDTYIQDEQCYVKLAAGLNGLANVVVAVFPTRPEQRSKLGMCQVSDNWRVSSVLDKPKHTDLTLAWGALAWDPLFWLFIQPDDPHVGYALQRSIEAGLDVRAVPMVGGFWDCGTPDEYFDLIKSL